MRSLLDATLHLAQRHAHCCLLGTCHSWQPLLHCPALPSADVQPTPLKALVAGVQNVGCGVDFTVWLGGGKLFTAGNGQYGVLGDGADHSYNAKDCEREWMQGFGLVLLKRAACNKCDYTCGM